MVARKFFNHVSPDRTLPIEFQMIKPVRSLNQGWPIAHGSVSDAHAVGGGTESDFLFQHRRVARKTTRQLCGTAMLCCTETDARFQSGPGWMCSRKSFGRRQTDAAHDPYESGIVTQTLPSRIHCDVNHPAVVYFISSVQP